MSKLSILIITKDFPPLRSTHGRLSYDLAHKLSTNGHRVTVITKSDSQNIENSGAIKIHTVSGLFANTDIKRLGKKLNKHHVVISVTSDALMLEASNFLAKKLFAKHIQWAQEIYPEVDEVADNQLLLKKLFCSSKRYHRAQKQCDNFVVPGRCMSKKIKDHHILPQKVSYIPNWTNLHGLHLEKMPNIKNNINNSTADLKIKRDDSPKFRIIHAGNLTQAHPVDIILEAAEILKEYSEIEFVFIGDEHSHNSLGQQRDRKHLDNVRFIPYQPTGHYQNILSSGDIHLVTLKQEYNGLLVPCKFYSSLTVGRPVIYLGPKESEIGQVMKSYNCGPILEKIDAQILVNSILDYRHNGDAWFAAQEGAINASQDFNPTNSLEQWVDLIGKIVK